MMHENGLSFVIPCFNSGYFLVDAVQSAIDQSLTRPYEIIVINDGSDDENTFRALAVVDKMPSVRVLHNESRQGAQQARNRGVQEARFEFIMSLDSDDKLSTDQSIIADGSYPDKAMAILQADDGMAFVHTMSRMFGAYDGLTISSYPCSEELVISKHHVPISILYRREDALAGALYDPRIRKWTDWSFAISLLDSRWKRGLTNRIGFIDGPYYQYRVHDKCDRLSSASVDEYEMTLITVQAHLSYFQQRFGNRSAQELASWVLAHKPSRLIDLLHMAAFNLEQAINVVCEREFDLVSPYSRLGIP